jgi:hypothetical protein
MVGDMVDFGFGAGNIPSKNGGKMSTTCYAVSPASIFEKWFPAAARKSGQVPGNV